MALDQATVVKVLVAERAKLLAYIWSIVRDEHTVEDVFQEVSILAVQKCHEIENPRVLWAWLRQTAKYRSLHALRVRGKQLILDEHLLSKLDLVWPEYDQTPSPAMIDSLLKCVAELTPNAQQIVGLRYVDGLSGIEVAKRLKREVHAVYMALSRIHSALRRCIQQRMAALRDAGE